MQRFSATQPLNTRFISTGERSVQPSAFSAPPPDNAPAGGEWLREKGETSIDGGFFRCFAPEVHTGAICIDANITICPVECLTELSESFVGITGRLAAVEPVLQVSVTTGYVFQELVNFFSLSSIQKCHRRMISCYPPCCFVSIINFTTEALSCQPK